MKKISVMVACYNEVENVEPLSRQLIECMERDLPAYDYELLFIDNRSTDGTRERLEQLCAQNSKIKAIFNIANFGQMRSPVYGMKQTTGDCTIKLCADFQDPIEMIPVFVREWEKGARIVIGIKTRSKENKLMYLLRGCYYRMLIKLSDIQHIQQFTGFGLYDRSFVDIVRQIDDPIPYFRGIVAEFGGSDRVEIPYTQPLRRAGKSKNNLLSLYDIAMTAMTTYSKGLMRLSVLVGGICAAMSLLIGLVYTIYKLLNWNTFSAGIAPMVIGVFLLGGIQLIFIGVLGEYILTINARTIRRPLVIEEKRINFRD